MGSGLKISHKTIDPKTGEVIFIERNDSGTRIVTKEDHIEKMRVASEESQLKNTYEKTSIK